MQDLKDFHSADVGLHIIHNVNKNVRFKIFNYSNSEGYDYEFRTPGYTGLFNMTKLRNYTIANFIKQKENSEIMINGGYSISRESFQYSITDLTIDKQDAYFSTTYQYFFSKISLKTGVSVDYRESDTKGAKAIYYYAQSTEHPYVEFTSFESFFLPELFLYGKYYLTDNLILGTGVRKNIKVYDISDFWSYQANLNYKLNNKHNFNLSAGNYNKLSMPNAEQYSVTHFESNQITLDYTFKTNKIELQAAIFNKETDYDDKTNYVNGGEIYSKINVKPFEIQLSFTAVDAEIKNGNTSHPSNYDLDYFIKSAVKYNVKGKFEISAIYTFRQGTHYLPVLYSNYDSGLDTYYPTYNEWNNSQRLPDYHKIDFSISKFWVINSDLALVLFANASNILNTGNVRAINYNSDYSVAYNEFFARRTFYFGVSIMF